MAPFYRTDLDGLRALAVGLVVLEHTGLAFPGGYIGVDVFFVLSGFLITRLILADCRADAFTLKAFWTRRIRRIAPAAAVMVVTVLMVGALVLPPRNLAYLARSASAQQLLLANLDCWLHTGYFDPASEMQPLLHTWSLAVEEQFYLLWPLLLLVLWKHSRRWIGALIATIIVASLALSECLVRFDASAAFYWMPSRMWELLLGAGVLFLPTRWAWRLPQARGLGWLGLGLILYAAWTYTPETPFPGVAACLPCLGAVLVIAAPAAGCCTATRLLSLPAIVYVGRASYSIYLWHWPLLVFSKILVVEPLTGGQRVALALGSMALGSLSYEFIEMPIRQRRLLSSNRRLVTVCSLSTATIGAVCLAGACWLLDSGEDRDVVPAVTPQLAACLPSPVYTLLGDLPPTEVGGPVGEVRQPNQPPVFVLWGDSHAKALAPLCDSLARSRGIYGVCLCQFAWVSFVDACTMQCPQERQRQWNRQVIQWIRAHQVHHVILAARLENKISTFSFEGEAEALSTGDPTRFLRLHGRRAFQQAVAKTVATLSGMQSHLWFVRQVPVQETDALGNLKGDLPLGVTKAEYERQQQEISAVLTSVRSPDLTVIGPGANWFDQAGYSLKGDSVHPFYKDGNHLNAHGVEKLMKPLLEPVFDAIAGDTPYPAEMAARSSAP